MVEARGIQRSRRAVLAFIACVLLLLGTVFVGAYLRADSLSNTCEAVNGNRTILRGILRRSEQLSLAHSHPDFSTDQIMRYYQRSIHDLAPAQC